MRVQKWATIMCILACGTFIFTFTAKSIFGKMGASLTLKIRQALYESVMSKNIGWFDERENSSGVITSTMASDSSTICGASSESLGPQMEGMFTMLGGLVIALIYCW